MARANTIQTNFSSGEVSPQMLGRVDVNKYFNGFKSGLNMIVRPQGGVIRRPGTNYIFNNGTYTRNIPFVYSATQTYVLVFSNNALNFITGGAVVTVGSTPYSIVTPYLAADLDGISYAQSGDVLFLAHPNYPPMVLTRLGNSNWTIAPYIFLDGPYMDVDTSETLLQCVVNSDTTTLVQSVISPPGTGTTLIASANTFSSGSVGQYVLYPQPAVGANIALGTQHLWKVSSYSTPTVVGITSLDSSFVNWTYAGLTNTSTSITLSLTSNTLVTPSSYFEAQYVGKYFLVTASAAAIVTGVTSVSMYNISHGLVFYYVTFTLSQLPMLATTNTLTINGNTGGPANPVANQLVEYRDVNQWNACIVQNSITSNTYAVTVLDNVVANPGNFDVRFSGSVVGQSVIASSSFSGVFDPSMVGQYIRSTYAQMWGIITAFVNDSSVVVTVVNVFSYTYPVMSFALLQNRSIIVTINATNPGTSFASTDVGRQIRLQFGAAWRSVTITSVLNSTQVIGTMSDYMPWTDGSNVPYNNGFVDNFRMGSWSQTTGFPSIVSLYQERVIWANTVTQPESLWFTVAGDYYNMAPTDPNTGQVTATNAIYVTLSSGKADPVSWILPGQVLIIGTTNTEYQCVAPNNSEGIGPSNIGCYPQSSFGSLLNAIGYQIGVSALFLQRGGIKLREMTYMFQFSAFNAKDITVMSEHILRYHGGAKIMAYQSNQVPIIWIVCNDGYLIGCTYDKDQEVVAWHRHSTPGGKFVSVIAIPSYVNPQNDEVYFVVERSGIYCVEQLGTIYDSQDSTTSPNFLDCNLSYAGPAITNIPIPSVWASIISPNNPGIYANEAWQPSSVITTTGSPPTSTIASTVPVTSALVGIPYTSYIQNLELEGGSQAGSSQGKRKRASEAILRVKDSQPFMHGPNNDATLVAIDVSNFNLAGALTANNNPYTGDVRISIYEDYITGGSTYFVQQVPYPLTILGIMFLLNTNE